MKISCWGFKNNFHRFPLLDLANAPIWVRYLCFLFKSPLCFPATYGPKGPGIFSAFLGRTLQLCLYGSDTPIGFCPNVTACLFTSKFQGFLDANGILLQSLYSSLGYSQIFTRRWGIILFCTLGDCQYNPNRGCFHEKVLFPLEDSSIPCTF